MTDELPRPAPSAGDKKEFRITVRISESELQALREEAKRRYLTVGAALRMLIREMGKARHR